MLGCPGWHGTARFPYITYSQPRRAFPCLSPQGATLYRTLVSVHSVSSMMYLLCAFRQPKGTVTLAKTGGRG